MADFIIGYPNETKSRKLKFYLTPDIKKTYLSDEIKDFLKLNLISN